MKRFGLYIIILYSVLLVAGCRDRLEYPVDLTPKPRAEAERTVIIYMAADNTLDNYPSAARADTTEMVSSKDMIPENVNFIIFMDTRSGKPAIYELSAKNGMQLWKQYGEELCSTSADVMLQVLREIKTFFPARHYGITFWSHATGWTPRHNVRRKTFGQDDYPGTSTSGETEMEIPVLRDVLAQLPKFDYIFFDACFMQCIEVAYELREVTDYMIGSPAEIPGPGAPYYKIVEPLCQGDAMGIVRGYDSGYPSSIYTGVLLSCIDCSQLESLAEATGRFLTPFYMGHTEPSTQGFLCYCDMAVNKFTYCFDMRTTMRRLLPPEEYAAWMELYNQAVPLYTLTPPHDGRIYPEWYANYCDYSVIVAPECYGGVSMFVPMTRYDTDGYHWNEDFQKTAWYTAAGWAATGW